MQLTPTASIQGVNFTLLNESVQPLHCRKIRFEFRIILGGGLDWEKKKNSDTSLH